MFQKEDCPRCGRPLIAGQCPACAGAPAPAPQRKILAQPAFGMVAAAMGLLLPLASFAMHWVLWHRAQAVPARWMQHEGPVAQLSELHGRGTIYLVQLTPHKAAYSAEELAGWLHTRYGLDARTLAAEPLPESAWNGWRRQYVAELLYAAIRKEHPALAANPDAYLIGLTDADMYPVGHHWASTFTERDGERAAIVSSATLTDGRSLWRSAAATQAANEHLEARMRRVLLKDVAMLYWHLPPNNDPSSLLHQPQNPDVPTEELYESDLDPARSRWGQFEGEPCLDFRYSAATGLGIAPGALVQTCSGWHVPQEDDATELFQVDLRLGMMVDRRTDLRIAGAMPIEFERALRPGWRGDAAFGVSGTDSYDSYLESRDNVYISAVSDAGMCVHLVRDPIWLSYLPLTKYVDTDLSGSYYTLRWRTSPYPHYDLTRYDGQIEAYLPCSTSKQFCSLNGVKDGEGRELKIARDGQRHLLEVVSPEGAWVKLRYGPRYEIEEADDSRGQSVRYGYNERNQLTQVTYASGETLFFTYDEQNELTNFSASPDGKAPAKVLLRSTYENGLLMRQSLADGSSYEYRYGPVDDRQTRAAMVRTPEGKVYAIRRYGTIAGVWEIDAEARRGGSGPQSERAGVPGKSGGAGAAR